MLSIGCWEALEGGGKGEEELELGTAGCGGCFAYHLVFVRAIIACSQKGDIKVCPVSTARPGSGESSQLCAGSGLETGLGMALHDAAVRQMCGGVCQGTANEGWRVIPSL